MEEAYLGLGSNLHQPRQQLKTAINSLAQHPAVQLLAVSGFCLSKPYGQVEQPNFLNAVVLIKTPLTPRNLLLLCQEIEAKQHRKRSTRWGPRTIDIDLLLMGDLTIHHKDLTLPHPRLQERDFVLTPLKQLSPHLVIPGLGAIQDLHPPQTHILCWLEESSLGA